MITLRVGGCTARINPENQQLVSLQRAGNEYLHGGGKPEHEKEDRDRLGWPNSEIIMFPLVGPARSGVLHARGRQCRMGQHGIARHLQFMLTDRTESTATFRLIHAGEPVRSTKSDETYEWPFPCEIRKHYALAEDRITVTFTVQNTGSEPMPYMFGWHPAFRLMESGIFMTPHGMRTVEEVKEASKTGAMLIEGTAVDHRSGNRCLIVTSDFGTTMLWSPDAPMCCIEPVTQFARFEGTAELDDRLLEPGQAATYTASIIIRGQ